MHRVPYQFKHNSENLDKLRKLKLKEALHFQFARKVILEGKIMV